MESSRVASLTRLASIALLAGSSTLLAASPSTFGTIVGSAVLCFDQIDNPYFFSYLSTSFGPPYKREGGAWWFKADANLWGLPITDVMLGDDTSATMFIGAVVEATPDKLDEAIVAATGVRHPKADDSAFPLRLSNPGSKIIYFKNKSKIYCDKYQTLPLARP